VLARWQRNRSMGTGCSSSATPDMTQRMQELEKQVAELKAALASMKTSPPPEAAPAAPAAAAAATPAPAAPSPITITSLLGSTTLSGFIDGYYGLNFNHPASHTSQLRNFDIETNQFGLNMIELVADKAPDATASRLVTTCRWLWPSDEYSECA